MGNDIYLFESYLLPNMKSGLAVAAAVNALGKSTISAKASLSAGDGKRWTVEVTYTDAQDKAVFEPLVTNEILKSS